MSPKKIVITDGKSGEVSTIEVNDDTADAISQELHIASMAIKKKGFYRTLKDFEVKQFDE